jgi:peptidyl-prolyl cis-trans isomerase C
MSIATRLAVAAIALSLGAAAHAQDATPPAPAPEPPVPSAQPVQPARSGASADTVVATVDGTDITLGNMIALRERLPETYQSLPPQTLFDGVLEQLIQQTALASAAGEPDRRTTLMVENERRSLMASQVIQQTAETAVTDAAIQDAYDEAYADAEPITEWNASHILVATDEEAQALVTQLNAGADFAQLAQEKSTGPSGPGGGELGWFGPGTMVAPFEEAVSQMDVGQISAPVQTQFGWHVMRLNDKRQKDRPSLDEVRADLVADVQQRAVEKAIADATAGAEITRPEAGVVDPAAISDMSLLD